MVSPLEIKLARKVTFISARASTSQWVYYWVRDQSQAKSVTLWRTKLQQTWKHRSSLLWIIREIGSIPTMVSKRAW